MKNWKFTALILMCALAWLGMVIGALFFRQELEAMPPMGRLAVAFVVSAPVIASFSLLTYQLNALKHDEYQQQQLRGQMLWASTMAILMTATSGFAMAYEPGANSQIYVMTVTAWFTGFLLRGLSSSARL